MKIQKPIIEILNQEDQYEHLANCASICYASNIKNPRRFAATLWNAGHKSMYRHVTVHYVVNKNACENFNELYKILESFKYCPYIFYKRVNNVLYVTTNLQFVMENPKICIKFEDYQILISDFNEICPVEDLKRYTIVIKNTGIDVSRELNRTSPNNISEQSTRYVDFNKKIGINFKYCHWMDNLSWRKKLIVKLMAKVDEWFYKISRSKYGLNLPPEDARWCLFLDTCTKVCYTYTVGEWKRILDLRYYETTGKAHPDAKCIAAEIRDALIDAGITTLK